MQDKLADAERKVALAEANENNLRAQLKLAESTIHKLKDDAARAKKFVAETRAACANEVRKRDRQIEGLKKAASEAGRARGERKSAAITTIQVTGEIGGDAAAAATASTMADDYDLRQETNGFLAQLAKGLSEENETLLSLIQKTNRSLKHMSGWDKAESGGAGGAAAAASAGASSSANSTDGNAVVMVTNPEDLATDIEGVLGHLRTMLTNPSFVPLEEVVLREEEIFRLRHGWEKMEERWREAVHLIDGWRQRMAANGQPVDMEDLKMGLRLSPVRVQNIEETSHNDVFQLSTLHEEDEEEEEEEENEEEVQNSFERLRNGSPSPPESLHLVPAPEYPIIEPEYEEPQDDLDDSDAESSIFHDDVDMEELEEPEPNVEILQYSTTNEVEVEVSEASDVSDSIPLPQPPKITPLEETASAGNRKPTGRVSRKRSGEYIAQDDDDDVYKAPPPPPHSADAVASPQKRLRLSTDEEPKTRPNSNIFTESNSSLDSILLLKPSPESSVSTAPSRATARSTRSNEAPPSKKEAPSPAPPASATKPAATTTRRTRAAAQAHEKKDTPSRPLPRQRQTRATAATASSSARSAPGTATKPRAAVPASSSSATTTKTTTTTATAEMPPPPRPTRSGNNSPAVVQATPKANTATISSSKNRKSGPEAATPAPEPTTTSRSRAKQRQQQQPVTVAEPPALQESPPKTSSRLPKPRNVGVLPPPQQSPLSMARIAAKLAASEREADAARVRAKLKAARLGNANTATATAANSNSSNSNNSLAQVPPPPPQASSLSSSRVLSGSVGDPTKRDRQASSSSAITGRSVSGSVPLDENGQAGGVSISAAAAAATRIDSDASSFSRNREHRHQVEGTTDNDNDEDNKTVGPSSPPRRPRRVAREVEAPTPAASSSRRSPTKVSAAPPPPTSTTTTTNEKATATTTRKREPRSRAEKVANRRRSTLSPWELQSLIAGEVVPPTPRLPEGENVS